MDPDAEAVVSNAKDGDQCPGHSIMHGELSNVFILHMRVSVLLIACQILPLTGILSPTYIEADMEYQADSLAMHVNLQGRHSQLGHLRIQ